jgi:hypothetical protein
MNKINSGLFAVALMLVATVAQAGTVRLTGNVGNVPAGMHSGTINVVFDLNAADSFKNGGVQGLQVTNSNPGLIRFTSFAVANPANWSSPVVTTVTDSLATITAQSVNTNALSPAGGQGVVFAVLGWEHVGVTIGEAILSIVLPEEALVDGRDGGVDVTADYTFQSNFNYIPEPGTLAMVGMSLVGLAFRRRNG